MKQKGKEVGMTLEPECPSLPSTHVPPHCHADAPLRNMVIQGGWGDMGELKKKQCGTLGDNDWEGGKPPGPCPSPPAKAPTSDSQVEPLPGESPPHEEGI